MPKNNKKMIKAQEENALTGFLMSIWKIDSIIERVDMSLEKNITN